MALPLPWYSERDGFLIFINTLKYSKNTEKQKDSYLYILLKYFTILQRMKKMHAVLHAVFLLFSKVFYTFVVLSIQSFRVWQISDLNVTVERIVMANIRFICWFRYMESAKKPRLIQSLIQCGISTRSVVDAIGFAQAWKMQRC